MDNTSKTELYQRGIPLLAFLPVLALLTGEAAASSDEWETASPTSVGLDPGVLQTLVQKIRVGEFQNIHSLLVIRNGRLVVEEYFQGADERRGEPRNTHRGFGVKAAST